MSRLTDNDGIDLFSHLVNHSYCRAEPYADVQTGNENNRLNLVLETFYAILGKTGMCSLLTTSLFEQGHESFIHVLANQIEYPDGNQHFSKVFHFLRRRIIGSY